MARWFIAIFAVGFFVAAAGGAAFAQTLAEAIELELFAQFQSAQTRTQNSRIEAIRAHYRETGYQSIWFNNGGLHDKAGIAVQVLENARDDGLVSSDYNAGDFSAIPPAGDQSGRAKFEVALTKALVAFAQHMNSGRLDPRKVNREIVIYPKTLAPGSILHNFRQTSNLKAYLRLLAPHTRRYERLRTALGVYRKIAAAGGWTQLPKGPVLKPGMEDERVPILRKRLLESNDLRSTEAEATLKYSPTLVDAVMKFQERHGLEMDGVIGPQTLAAINTPVEDRIATMEINMERNRWMQNDFGAYHVFANLADQVVKLVKNGKTIHAELIQVGKPYHRTPVFSDKMEYLELNPYWNVPPSIAVNEYLPKLKRDPGYLRRANLQVLRGGSVVSTWSVPWSSYGRGRFPVRLRQPPGKKNALGRVKFMFPNKFNVYIHDTPSKGNFNRASRFFSHGCLRLRDPLKLAEIILGPEGKSRKWIDGVIRSGKRRVVKLKQEIPVHVVYLTSWVNKDGSVNFRKDVYGRDRILEKALSKVRN